MLRNTVLLFYFRLQIIYGFQLDFHNKGTRNKSQSRDVTGLGGCWKVNSFELLLVEITGSFIGFLGQFHLIDSFTAISHQNQFNLSSSIRRSPDQLSTKKREVTPDSGGGISIVPIHRFTEVTIVEVNSKRGLWNPPKEIKLTNYQIENPFDRITISYRFRWQKTSDLCHIKIFLPHSSLPAHLLLRGPHFNWSHALPHSPRILFRFLFFPRQVFLHRYEGNGRKSKKRFPSLCNNSIELIYSSATVLNHFQWHRNADARSSSFRM